MEALEEKKLAQEALRIVQDDISAQKSKFGSAVFIDEEVYDLCFPTVKDTVDYTSLSKFLLKFHPEIGVNESLQLFHPNYSPGSKLVNLLTMGGTTYGYHLIYLALREDRADKPGRKEAVELLESTAKKLGKIPPDHLFHGKLPAEGTNYASPTTVATLSTGDDDPQGLDQSLYDTEDKDKKITYTSEANFGLNHLEYCKCPKCKHPFLGEGMLKDTQEQQDAPMGASLPPNQLHFDDQIHPTGIDIKLLPKLHTDNTTTNLSSADTVENTIAYLDSVKQVTGDDRSPACFVVEQTGTPPSHLDTNTVSFPQTGEFSVTTPSNFTLDQ